MDALRLMADGCLSHAHCIRRRRNRALLEIADLVTEMTLVKHPYQAGYRAQREIEF